MPRRRLIVDVPSARTTDAGTLIIDRTPARSLRTTMPGEAVRCEIGLDDLRPWRVAALYTLLRGTFAVPLPAIAPGPTTIVIVIRSPRDGAIMETLFTSVGVLAGGQR